MVNVSVLLQRCSESLGLAQYRWGADVGEGGEEVIGCSLYIERLVLINEQ